MSDLNRANERTVHTDDPEIREQLHKEERDEKRKDHEGFLERIEEDLKEFGDTETTILEDTFNGIDAGKNL